MSEKSKQLELRQSHRRSRIDPDGTARIRPEEIPSWIPEAQPPFLPIVRAVPARRGRMLLALLRYYGPAAVVFTAFLAGVIYILQDSGRAGRSLSDVELQSLRAATASAEEISHVGEEPGTRSDISREVLILSALSYPSGATVRVDGEVVGQTPLVYRPPLPGLVTVSVEKEGYMRQDTAVVLVRGGGPVRVSVILYPQGGRLSPEGEDVGGAPLTVRTEEETLLPRPEDLDERQPAEQSRTVESPAPTPAEVTEPPPARRGRLLIDSDPQGASVHLRGQEVGTTPLFLETVEPGSYTYTIRKEGYKPHELHVEVTPDQVTTGRAELSPLQGKLSVLVRPWGSVYVDDRMVARETDTEHHMDLPVGQHTVRVVHPVLGSRTQRVRITVEGVQRVVVDFNQ